MVIRSTSLVVGSFLVFGLGACASTPKGGDGRVDLADDQVVMPGETPGGGDDELDGGDYLVQVEKDFKVGKFQGGGLPTGKTGFDLVDGNAVRSATYYATRKASSNDLVVGKTACYYADNEKDEVFGKAASKDAARSGRWRCRVVRDLAEKDTVLIGDQRVARDNVRVEASTSSGL